MISSKPVDNRVRVRDLTRHQDRGYRHKGWRDPDTLPSVEKMKTPPTRRTNKKDSISVNLHIYRSLDTNASTTKEYIDFLDRATLLNPDVFNSAKSNKVRTKSNTRVTYFGSTALRKAMVESTNRAYLNFGVDVKQTRDCVNRLKGSFIDFLRDGRFVQREILDPIYPPEYIYGMGTGVDNRSQPSREDLKWSTMAVGVDPIILALGGNAQIYLALDLNGDERLREEKEAIRQFLNKHEGLDVADLPHEVNGRPVPEFNHATFAVISENDVIKFDPKFDTPPLEITLLPPNISARV